MNKLSDVDQDTQNLLVFIMCALLLAGGILGAIFVQNARDPQHPLTTADSLSETALGISVITLFIVVMQFVISYQELRVVREDLKNNNVLFKRQLRESSLWPYGYIRYEKPSVEIDGTESRIYALMLKVKNVGEIVDIRYSVIVGVHKFWEFTPSSGWRCLEWQPKAANAKYRFFKFYKYVSTDPIHVGDYAELPAMKFQLRRYPTQDLSRTVIFARVSTDYKANPEEGGHYLRVVRRRDEAELSEVVYIYEKDEVPEQAIR